MFYTQFHFSSLMPCAARETKKKGRIGCNVQLDLFFSHQIQMFKMRYSILHEMLIVFRLNRRQDGRRDLGTRVMFRA